MTTSNTETLLTEIGHDRRLLVEAAGLVVSCRSVSASNIQRRVRVGFVKAARLLDLLEQCGIVAPHEGAPGRRLLVTPEGLPAHLEKLGLAAPAPPVSMAPGEPPVTP